MCPDHEAEAACNGGPDDRAQAQARLRLPAGDLSTIKWR